MKIDEIAASWDRVKVSIGARPRQQTLLRFQPRTPEIHRNLWKLTPDLEIYGNPQNP